MRKVDRDQIENKSSGRFWAIGAAALLSLAVFAAGIFSGTILNSWMASDGTKLNGISQILEESWYYASDFENLNESLLENGVEGTAQLAGDPYTEYLSGEENAAMNERLSGVKKGIGIEYIPDFESGSLFVRNVYVNSPAEQAGFAYGDRITAIDGTPVAELDVETIPDYISVHDDIVFDILREDQTLQLQVTPSTYNPTVSARIVDGAGLIQIRTFANDTAAELKRALQAFKEQGIEDLIIDVRGNTGGYVDTGIEAAGYLIGGDQVVFYDDLGDGVIDTYKTNPDTESYSFDQIYLLQNGETASAAEMFVAALKDTLNEDVTVIGQTSYGKGTVQDRRSFSDGTTLKYTRSLWMRPNGEYLNQVGITPDVLTEAVSYSVVIVPDQPDVIPDTVSVNAPAVQSLLQYLEYPVDRTDTYFSAASSQALTQFQSEHGLPETGIADEATLQALLDAARQKAVADTSNRELDEALNRIRQDMDESKV